MIHQGYASLTGFGNPDGHFCRFDVLRNNRGEYGDWDAPLRYSDRQIIGSNDTETQLLGFGAATITLTVEFLRRDDFRVFRSLQGTVQTLRLLADFTSHEGAIKHELGRDYEYFDDTLFLSMSTPIHNVDGTVTVTATFQRPNHGMGVLL